MIKRIKIGKKLIGKGKPVFIIAEAGVNHNSRLDLALKMIDVAAAAGADAVKFQTFEAHEVATAGAKMSAYQRRNTGQRQSQLGLLKKMEISKNFYQPLLKRCRDKKIIFLSTPHGSFGAVDWLNRLKVPALKFGSGDLTNLPVLQYAAKFNKPMILGTGMATLAETKEAISAIKQAGNNRIIVLHCTSNYPCPLNQVNLRAMLVMKDKLPALVGYSDHTSGLQVPVMAATLGAAVIEKHFTLNKNMPGPDHRASLDSVELKTMVAAIRRVEVILGSGVKKPNRGEGAMIRTARKSLVASDYIKQGEVFGFHNLAIKRPGTGQAPKTWFKLLGKQSDRDYKPDEMIKLK